MISVNPANLKKISEYKTLNKVEISNKIELTHKDFLLWKDVSVEKRKTFLLNLSEELSKNIDSHAKIITSEMGKPIKESRAEVEKCVWLCNYYAEHSIEFLKNKEIKTDAKLSYLSYEPLGVLFGVMPWNFPYWQVFRYFVPSIMAGNACLLKHASNVSGCALAIEELFNKIYPYKNLFNVLLIKSNLVKEIIENDLVKAVTLTGSEQAGSSVAMIAGKEIKKTLLELGGSDPFIVLSDANINECVQKAVKSRFLNAGQSCIAAKRFIVHADVYNEFINKVLIEIKSLKVGNPMIDTTDVGPLAKKNFVNELDALVKNSVNQGAKLLHGGDIDGCYYTPSLLIDVEECMDVFKSETFGPVFCVTKCKSDEHALFLANKSCYGLSSSVWTSDDVKASFFATSLNSGAVFINDMSKSDPRLPFGGINKSGYGRELSELGLKEFVNVKTVVCK